MQRISEANCKKAGKIMHPSGIDLSGVCLIGLDMDGTVFTSEKKITQRTKKAIEAAAKSGIRIMAATGRPLTGVPEEFRQIPGVRFLLCSNGAAVYDQEEERWIYQKCLSAEQTLDLLREYRKLTCIFEVYRSGLPYIEEKDLALLDDLVPDPFIRAYMRKTRKKTDNLESFIRENPDGIEKLNLSFQTKEERDRGKALLRDLNPKLLGVSGLPTNFEICQEGVDKGEGMLAAADLLHIDRNAVMAVGDSENDCAMLEKCAFGIAMGNCDKKTAASADLILPYTNDEDGVAILLEEIVKARLHS